MEYEDRLTISTPEGVDLELTLAGVGSRLTAALVDTVIQGVLIGAAAVLLLAVAGGGFGTAAFLVVLTFAMFGYDIMFEVLAAGRTPGKRATGIRVVRQGGQPVGFLTSAVRNLLRLVDILPFAYVVGVISILVTARNQRLGDLAAGTLVVRERRGTIPRHPHAVAWGEGVAAPAWDVSAISAGELAAVRSFLERRHGLTSDARTELALTLADRLRPKVGGAHGHLGSEAFLEQLATAKAARG